MASDFNPTKFFKKLNKVQKDKEALIDFSENIPDKYWYHSGSIMLDSQLHGGTLGRGGIASGKITVLAGPESCGKTYFAISAMKDFLKKNPEAWCAYFDSEENINRETFERHNVPDEAIDRISIINVETIEEFRRKMIKTYDNFRQAKIMLMLVIDSYGNLISEKENEEAVVEADTAEGKDVALTKEQKMKATMGKPQSTSKTLMKIMTHRAMKSGAPAIVVTHVYETMDTYSKKVMSGGTGIKYTNSNCIFFDRLKDSKETVVNNSIHKLSGIIVKSTLVKSRFSREETVCHSYIDWSVGVRKYYSIVSLLDQAGLIMRKGNNYRVEYDPEAPPEVDTPAGKKRAEDGEIGEWVGKKWSAKALSEADEILEGLLPKLEPWTIANFALGQKTVSIPTSIDGKGKKKKKLDLEKTPDEEVT